ncbi:reverse transcriptase domain-containing protein, partial [Tanacetum coccineum]
THRFSAADRKKHDPEVDLLLQQGPTRRINQLPSAREACLCLADVIKVDTPATVTTGKKSIMLAKPRGHDKETWTLHTDGASTKASSRAGLVLRIPPGHYFVYALKFDFEASNNKAKYEALLAGLL